MTPHYTDHSVTLYHADCLDVLRELPDNSVDAVVTDLAAGTAAEHLVCADYLPLIVQRVNRQRDPIAYTTAAGEDLGLFGLDGEIA